MRFTELIWSIACDRFAREARLGVRLSPVFLSAAEAPELVELARSADSRTVFCAVAVPGAALDEGPTWCVAPGERAAEVATAWRNRVSVAAGERILYVSVDRQGKAGGLSDTLYELTEAELRRAFFKIAAERHPSTQELLNTLEGAKLHESTDARALCDYLRSVVRQTAPPQPVSLWEAAGQELPRLGLAVDSSLASDPAERLRANVRWVRDEATPERKARGLTADAKRERSKLRSAVRSGAQAKERLRKVDLGELSSADLQSDVSRTRRAPTRKSPVRPSPPTAPAPSAQNTDTRQLPLQPPLTPPPSQTVPERDGLWTPADQARELGGSRGISARLLELVRAQVAGSGLAHCWTLQTDKLRPAVERPPQSLDAPQELPLAALPVDITDLHRTWQGSRAALAASLLSQRAERTLLDELVQAPLVALDRPALRAAVRAHVECSSALLEAAAGAGGSDLCWSLLALDTLSFTARSGDEPAPAAGLVLIGPLHPLWLGQALARYDQLEEARTAGPLGRRLLARALAVAPLAPARWTTPLGELELEQSAPLGGLLCFEDRTRAVSEEAQRSLGERLLETLAELAPYTRLGARLVVHGRDPAGLLEGIASWCDRQDDSGPSRAAVRVYLSQALVAPESARSSIESGRLALLPLPRRECTTTLLAPHAEVWLEPAQDASTAAVGPGPLVLSASTGDAVTRFSLTPRGLVATTPVAGLSGVAAVEAALAATTGSPPAEAFERAQALTELATAVTPRSEEQTTWQVVAAGRLTGSVPAGARLLAHEPVGGADVAVVSWSGSLAARSLAGALKAIGVQDQRASVLRELTVRLADRSRAGLLSLSGSPDQVLGAQLVCASLLDILGQDAVLARLEGDQRAALIGTEDPADSQGSYALAALPSAGRLRVWLGYAATRRAPPVGAVAGALRGVLAERLDRLLALVDIATRDRSPAGRAAREALAWVLWSAAAAHRPPPDGFTQALEAQGPLRLEVEGVRVLLPSGHELTRSSEPLRLGQVPVAVAAVDERLLASLVGST